MRQALLQLSPSYTGQPEVDLKLTRTQVERLGHAPSLDTNCVMTDE